MEMEIASPPKKDIYKISNRIQPEFLTRGPREIKKRLMPKDVTEMFQNAGDKEEMKAWWGGGHPTHSRSQIGMVLNFSRTTMGRAQSSGTKPSSMTENYCHPFLT